MLDNKYENLIKVEITKEKLFSKSFNQIIEEFDKKLDEINFLHKAVKIEEYFGDNIGEKTAREKLIKNNIIKEDWINIANGDFKGLYIFIHDNKPIYFGISRCVIRRVIQHIKGKTHFQATLAYNIGLIYYKIINGIEYSGKRDDFDFEKYVEPIKIFLLKQNIAFLNIEDDDELYLFEIYCSIKYKTILNKFETH